MPSTEPQYQQAQQPPVSSSRRSSMMGKSKRAHREVRFGSYVLGSTLGEGEFGKVKLGWRKDGKTPSQAAIKLIRRDSIPRGSERESKVHREINSLKRLAHPNIVRLEEVLQNDKYIGIVLEYVSGGELFDYILEHRYLKESMACKLFAQLVSGVDYMHSKGIVHRDLKLENLLLDKNKNIIISDFGFVNSFRDGNEMMKTSCGSPCYAAPELVVSSDPYEARKVDVWSCGVILYAMLAGYLPFDDDPQNPDGDNIARLYHYITHTPLTFPEYVAPVPRDLLRKVIVSNPKKRITLKETRSHSWLAPHAPFLSVTPQEWDRSYRSAKSRLHSNIDNATRRHSLMEGNLSSASTTTSTATAAFLLNSSHARSYSSHNVTQKLYSHPAAPQTSSSHAMASIPLSASSHEIPTMSTFSNSNPSTPTIGTSASPAQNNSMALTSAASPSASVTGPFPRGRTMSNASIALQAVVQADVVQQKTAMLPPSSATSTSTTSRLPGPHVKPRPTSYHPGLYSNNSANATNDIYSLLPFHLTSTTSASSTPTIPVLSTSTTSTPMAPPIQRSPVIPEVEQDEALVSNSSKISEPLVDLSSASGMLTSNEKRKSVAVDSLSSAIEQLSVAEESIEDQNTEPEKAVGTANANDEPTDQDKAAVEEPPVTLPVAETAVVATEATVAPKKDNDTKLKDIPPKVVPYDRENKENNKPSNRSKRFSFFYLSSTPTTQTASSQAETPQRTKSPASSNSSSSRKVLEPNNEANIIKSARHDDMRRGSNRYSMVGGPISASSGNGNPMINSRNKESSAAKKVVDFFKRRSMRV